jgi:putative endonuclease
MFRRDDGCYMKQSMREELQPAVYILASSRNGTLYIGVTGNLYNRIRLHKQGEIEGFTRKHNVKMLVWFKNFDTMELAIKEEKRLKEWQRR